MKRDIDLVRRIALAVEEMPANHQLDSVEGVDALTFTEHVRLMAAAGLVDARWITDMSDPHPVAVVLRLTWAGHDFLDAARSDTLWAKAKKSVIAPGASWTFDLVKDWLKEEIRQGLPTLRNLAQ